jgi:hypothetical protein
VKKPKKAKNASAGSVRVPFTCWLRLDDVKFIRAAAKRLNVPSGAVITLVLDFVRRK